MSSLTKVETPTYSPAFSDAIRQLQADASWGEFFEITIKKFDVLLKIKDLLDQKTKVEEYLKTENALYPSPEDPHLFVVYAKNQKLTELNKETEELVSYYNNTLRARVETIWKQMQATLRQIDPCQSDLFMAEVNKRIRALEEQRLSPPQTPQKQSPREEGKDSKSA